MPVALLEGHSARVLGALEISNKRLVSWSSDGTLRVWNADGMLVALLEGHTDCVVGAIELFNGHILSWSDMDETSIHHHRFGASLGISIDHTLRLWDLEGRALAVLE